MKKATKIAVTLVLVAVLLIVVSSFLWEEREPKLEVAVLHIGPIGDYGWTYEAHLGAQGMADALPYVELSERKEACGPDAPQIIREYAEVGNKVIFCHSYNFGEYIEEVAPDYPDVIFMWGAGVEKKAPNAGIYFGRMYEARFLTGIVAGAMTETNKIGYAAPLPTSEVVRGIDAFARGVASVNPDTKVYVEWVGEWYNPPKEKETALSLIDRGCDIITHHTDSYAPGEAAEERGVYFISYHSDMRRFAPDVFLTGTVWNWTPAMTDIVEAVHNRTWSEHPSQDWWYGLAEGGVQLAPFSDLVPDDVKEMVKEKKQAIIKGKFEVFPGMTDEELREIYYFEPNVVGELPVKEAEEVIKIGAIYPLTGTLATTGADVKNGVLLAVDIINNEHKIDLPLARSKGIDSLDGAKIEIVFGDSQGSPSAGKSEAERLIEKEKVVALIGCYQSLVTAEASQIAEDKGTPFLTALSSAPSLTQRGFNWFFRTTPNDKTFVQNFYQFLQDVRKEKGVKVEKLGIVHENSVWGSEFAAYAEQYAKEYGYQVVENVFYPADATNVTNEVQRFKDAHPDVVMQASYINDATLYMQTYKDMNFSPDAILANGVGFIAPEFLQTLGDDGNYILTRATWSNDLAEAKPLVGTVNQMFMERYGANMTGNSARAFTGMLVLADAINRAGSTDSEAIREALLETNVSGDKLIMSWDGVKFDHETHQNTLGKGIICQIIDQEYYTVWPWDIATKELIWPIPTWEEREQMKFI
ncbi:MAG: hypothetical protein AEth_01573 [Candidatus Argoarchaeum ethanivorans]|uniref:ABC transporter substrate-binding protein PnrA-like domain-containing protein n=1 Tax=Candidatus Argoarchaeum ethanivorans TaxID=2608793 RepID=A0A8B3S1U9_9EURY|nr:MAG: hypothetical protein AEth_01573 [Candidatus Argoarchaeum ethanivorans]